VDFANGDAFGGMLCFQRGQVNKSCVTNFRAENFFNLKGIYLFALHLSAGKGFISCQNGFSAMA
jgi:hypothetical protein